jgi:hypothetical protein
MSNIGEDVYEELLGPEDDLPEVQVSTAPEQEPQKEARSIYYRMLLIGWDGLNKELRNLTREMGGYYAGHSGSKLCRLCRTSPTQQHRSTCPLLIVDRARRAVDRAIQEREPFYKEYAVLQTVVNDVWQNDAPNCVACGGAQGTCRPPCALVQMTGALKRFRHFFEARG